MQIHRQAVEGSDGTYHLSYTDWGKDGTLPPVVCVHGLTRNGRDFDVLAEALATERRVICPDVVGRGASDRLRDPEQYDIPTYTDHMIRFIDRLELGQVDWVGTSMGGLIGMAVAAAEPHKIRRLVLNDVGPIVPMAAIERIRLYLGMDLSFAGLREVEMHLRAIHASFGDLTDANWRQMAEHSAQKSEDGTWRQHFDPQIGVRFAQLAAEDVDCWSTWDRIRCPVLVLRGTESDILSAETAAEMSRRGPGAELVAFEGVGHAPALMAENQIAVVRDWLRR